MGDEEFEFHPCPMCGREMVSLREKQEVTIQGHTRMCVVRVCPDCQRTRNILQQEEIRRLEDEIAARDPSKHSWAASHVPDLFDTLQSFCRVHCAHCDPEDKLGGDFCYAWQKEFSDLSPDQILYCPYFEEEEEEKP